MVLHIFCIINNQQFVCVNGHISIISDEIFSIFFAHKYDDDD